MKKYNFTVLIEQDEDGYFIAEVPALKGCHTQAKTMNQLMKRVKEVIELCLEVQKDELTEQPKFIGLQQIEVCA